MKRKTLNKLLVILLIGLIICGCNKAKRKIEGEKEFSQLVETIKENFKVILDKEKYIVRDSETPQGRIISRPFYEIAEKKPVKYKSKYFIKEEGAKVVITQQGEENFVLEYVPFFSDKESRVFIDIMIKYGFKPYVLNELIYDKSKGNDFEKIEQILDKYPGIVTFTQDEGWECGDLNKTNIRTSFMFVQDDKCIVSGDSKDNYKYSMEKIKEYGKRFEEYFSKERNLKDINWDEFMKYNNITPIIQLYVVGRKEITKKQAQRILDEISPYYNKKTYIITIDAEDENGNLIFVW